MWDSVLKQNESGGLICGKNANIIMRNHELFGGKQRVNWKEIESNTIQDYIEDAAYRVPDVYPTDFLDVSETISELSYLTHNYFRYYGKFPSKIAKYVIETLIGSGRINPKQDFIFDNYNGSGTTMVEAKIAGFFSAGIDINPFGVLASNVKTYNYDVEELKKAAEQLFLQIESAGAGGGQINLFQQECLCKEDIQGIEEIRKRVYLEFHDIDKWFEEDVIRQLSVIKYFILRMPLGKIREFFALGFFAIIRRVSRAYDAEVRPHVNPRKRKKDAVTAFEKKIDEMISTMSAWNTVTSASVVSRTEMCDNSSAADVTDFVCRVEKLYSRNLGLVVSHPPYLNCFDYIPVYKLKFLWAFGFEEIYGNMSYPEIKASEIRSYPANKDSFVNKYFAHNLKAYQIMFDCLRPGGYCCVVIGDCTIHKELFSVHKMLIHGMEKIGYAVDKVTYRSTAYGMGRYAYQHRADYTDSENGKQDAIIFFRKP